MARASSASTVRPATAFSAAARRSCGFIRGKVTASPAGSPRCCCTRAVAASAAACSRSAAESRACRSCSLAARARPMARTPRSTPSVSRPTPALTSALRARLSSSGSSGLVASSPSTGTSRTRFARFGPFGSAVMKSPSAPAAVPCAIVPAVAPATPATAASSPTACSACPAARKPVRKRVACRTMVPVVVVGWATWLPSPAIAASGLSSASTPVLGSRRSATFSFSQVARWSRPLNAECTASDTPPSAWRGASITPRPMSLATPGTARRMRL